MKRNFIWIIVGLVFIVGGLAIWKSQQKPVMPIVSETSGVSGENQQNQEANQQPVKSRNGFLLGANVTSGNAPLVVIFDVQFIGLLYNWVDFGDGTRADAVCDQWKPDTDACIKMKTITHTYALPGVYTVTYKEGYTDEAGKMIEEPNVESIEITVK